MAGSRVSQLSGDESDAIRCGAVGTDPFGSHGQFGTGARQPDNDVCSTAGCELIMAQERKRRSNSAHKSLSQVEFILTERPTEASFCVAGLVLTTSSLTLRELRYGRIQ
jgi:predicted nucleic acid-binding Zn ribbon protein